MRFQRLPSMFLAVCLAAATTGALVAHSAPPAPRAVAGQVQRSASRTRQATGEVVSFTGGSLVLLHARGRTKQRMAFVLTPETNRESGLVKGARVTVYYRLDKGGRRVARRIRAARGAPPHHIPLPAKPQP